MDEKYTTPVTCPAEKQKVDEMESMIRHLIYKQDAMVVTDHMRFILPVDGEFQAYYAPQKGNIILSEEWENDTYKIFPVILAHELGHIIDHKECGSMETWLSTGVIATEIIAWKKSVAILSSIGFDEWDYFYEFVSHCMSSYYRDVVDGIDYEDLFMGSNEYYGSVEVVDFHSAMSTIKKEVEKYGNFGTGI